MIINDSLLDYNNIDSLKDYVFQSGLLYIYSCYRKYSYYVYKFSILEIDEIPFHVLPYSSFEYFAINFPELWEICAKIYNSRKSKVSRIKSRIKLMLEAIPLDNFLFLTFTFRDNVFDTTCEKTRRVYVRRYLTSLDVPYIANIDFGERNGREHYHCIVAINRVDSSFWFNHYGALNFEKILNLKEDSVKLAYYIDKLANHSTKTSAGRLIYSRDLSKLRFTLPQTLSFDSDFPF